MTAVFVCLIWVLLLQWDPGGACILFSLIRLTSIMPSLGFFIFYFFIFFLEGDSLGNAQYKALIHSRESNEPRFKHF